MLSIEVYQNRRTTKQQGPGRPFNWIKICGSMKMKWVNDTRIPWGFDFIYLLKRLKRRYLFGIGDLVYPYSRHPKNRSNRIPKSETPLFFFFFSLRESCLLGLISRYITDPPFTCLSFIHRTEMLTSKIRVYQRTFRGNPLSQMTKKNLKKSKKDSGWRPRWRPSSWGVVFSSVVSGVPTGLLFPLGRRTTI